MPVWSRSERAATLATHSVPLSSHSVCSLPPCGGGLGRGVVRRCSRWCHIVPPPPPAPPHKGEGSTPNSLREQLNSAPPAASSSRHSRRRDGSCRCRSRSADRDG